MCSTKRVFFLQRIQYTYLQLSQPHVLGRPVKVGYTPLPGLTVSSRLSASSRVPPDADGAKDLEALVPGEATDEAWSLSP